MELLEVKPEANWETGDFKISENVLMEKEN